MARLLLALVGLALAAATPSPTDMPTAAPTAAPTLPLGRCCGVNTTVNAPFCKFTTSDECGATNERRFATLINSRRDLGGDSWEFNESCASSCSPLSGTTKNGGVVTLAVDISTAGFIGNDDGVELGPLELEGLPAPAQGEIILAFSVTHFKGLEVQAGGPLGAGFYILVTIESTDPVFTANQEVVLYRLDENTNQWVDSSADCSGVPANSFEDPAWSIPICHLSDFGLSLAGDGDDKDDKKPAKATKKDKKGKPSKAKSAPKDAGKPSKAAKDDPKGKASAPKGAKDTKGAKDVKAGKDKKTKVAVGAGVGAGVAAMAAAGGIVAWRKRVAAKQDKKPKRQAVATVSV